MPRLSYPESEDDNIGRLEVQWLSSTSVQVYYIPSKQRLRQAELKSNNPSAYKVKLLQADEIDHNLTIFPINTFPRSSSSYDFLKPQYSQIEAITIADWKYFAPSNNGRTYNKRDENFIDDFEVSDGEWIMANLELLPSCFVKDYDYGLGLTQSHRFIIEAIEELSECTEIVISKQHQTSIDEESKFFYVSNEDFTSARKIIDRTINNSRTAVQSVNYAATRNLFASRTGQPSIPVRTGRSPLRRNLTNAAILGEDWLTEDEQDDVLNVLARNTKSIATAKPAKLTALKNDMELVALETLIERYQEMMKTKVPETRWQEFLDTNSFILSLTFGYPIVKVRGQASVGGHRLSGSGETIADFLVKNNMTNNSAIIEIKTPNTKLLNKSPYRGEIYAPSSHLVGAVNQALNQKHNFEREISRIKNNSRMYDLESYYVRCCLIIGKIPDDEDMKKSFELYRGNSKNVEVITFDEVLEKLRSLKQLLTNQESDVTVNREPIELPW